MKKKLSPQTMAALRRSKKFQNWRPRIGRSEDTAAAEKHYTPQEVAKLWGVSADMIRDWFRNESGVLKMERPATRVKRGYLTLRIPESVLYRVHHRLTGS
jgi:hypothetical protein